MLPLRSSCLQRLTILFCAAACSANWMKGQDSPAWMAPKSEWELSRLGKETIIHLMLFLSSHFLRCLASSSRDTGGTAKSPTTSWRELWKHWRSAA